MQHIFTTRVLQHVNVVSPTSSHVVWYLLLNTTFLTVEHCSFRRATDWTFTMNTITTPCNIRHIVHTDYSTIVSKYTWFPSAFYPLSYELEQIAHDAHCSDSSAGTRTLHDQRPWGISFCVEHNDII
jgi:hypothetical protein